LMHGWDNRRVAAWCRGCSRRAFSRTVGSRRRVACDCCHPESPFLVDLVFIRYRERYEYCVPENLLYGLSSGCGAVRRAGTVELSLQDLCMDILLESTTICLLAISQAYNDGCTKASSGDAQ
jgi:hypothetical protein